MKILFRDEFAMKKNVSKVGFIVLLVLCQKTDFVIFQGY